MSDMNIPAAIWVPLVSCLLLSTLCSVLVIAAVVRSAHVERALEQNCAPRPAFPYHHGAVANGSAGAAVARRGEKAFAEAAPLPAEA
jgi:hypothetical protein